jgi:hypothetical protein
MFIAADVPTDTEPSDDLFDEPGVEPDDAPELKPEPADDLFDAPGGDADVEDAAADDLFDDPNDGPAEPEPDAADDGDLFDAAEDVLDDAGDATKEDAADIEDVDALLGGGGADDDAEVDDANFDDANIDDAGIDEADDKSDDNADESIDDLFGQAPAAAREVAANQLQHVAAPPRMDVLRTWTDNSGQYQVRGQLKIIFEGHVRFLKENGRYTTVPLSRLSAPDLEFVTGWLAHPGNTGDVAAR